MTGLSYFLLLLMSCRLCDVQGYNFGFNNSYTCHCLDNIQCNYQTGVCSNGCLTQWVGPSCQQENIAYGKTANQSGQDRTQGPLFAVDGDRSNSGYLDCIDTNYSPWAWWNVDLGQLFPIRYLKIYYLAGKLSHFKGFSVHIDDELCYQHTGDSNLPAVFSIECSRTITGRYVNISNIRPGETQHFFSLCEVEIYVCSGGTYYSDCNNFCHCSNYDKCDVKTGQCQDGCQIGWDGDSCSTECEESYGHDCMKRCSDRKCSGTSTCHHVTGECINGCTPGYLGIDCTQECERSYGENCSKQCSDRNCLDQSSCNNIDGECIGGCQAGYRSLDCTKQCGAGLYGLNCNSSCSERFCKTSTITCHHETGACSQDGCLDYYDGVDCTRYIGCADGYYGFGTGCNKLCSDRNCRSVDSSCDQVNGTCDLRGCLDGFQGHDCIIKKTSEANESKLSNVVSGIIGSIIGLLVGLLVGVGGHLWITRKTQSRVPETHYEDITMNSPQVIRDSTEHINQRKQQLNIPPQIKLQDTTLQTNNPTSSNLIGKSGRNGNCSSLDTQLSSSDTGHNYYNLQNNTYEKLDDTKNQSDNSTDYQSLK